MSEAYFICPVCKQPLLISGGCYICSNKHNYDISRSGYVNLLMSQQKNHGDDKLMVKSRQEFLDKGFYSNLRSALAEIIAADYTGGEVIYDVGCGECYYSEGIYDSLPVPPQMFCIDISKAALAASKKRNKSLHRAVAGIFNLPFADRSGDYLLNIFAPFCLEEFKRVLKKGGILLRVIPLENHLYALKQAVYQNPYKNTVNDFALEGFKFIGVKEVKNKIMLETNEDIKNLFTMTPYYYKSSAEDFAKLASLSQLEVETEFGIIIYESL